MPSKDELWQPGQPLTAKDIEILHRNSDRDSRAQALHHTLGNKSTQAAPGSHTHNGTNSLFLDRIKEGTGNPNGVVVAPIGTMYLNKTGGAGTTFWIKESGVGSNGWIAK